VKEDVSDRWVGRASILRDFFLGKSIDRVQVLLSYNAIVLVEIKYVLHEKVGLQ